MDEQSKKVEEPDSNRTPPTTFPKQWDDHRTTTLYQFKHYTQKFRNLQALYLDPLTRPPSAAEPGNFMRCCSVSPSDTKLTCCDFSSDGMFLAIGGHEKRVALYKVDKFKLAKMVTEHTNVITDLRFSSNSTMFATSSLDKTILLWDATKSGYTTKIQRTRSVLSLDFSERLPSYMCVSDSSYAIQFWVTDTSKPLLYYTLIKACMEGGNNQVRFQPKTGKLLAALSGKTLNTIDSDSYNFISKFQGEEEFRSICWSLCGSYIGSVSKNRAQFWCLRTGKCLSELKSNGEDFESCCIHPRFGGSSVMMIGCIKSVIYWNPHRTLSFAFDGGHTDVVSCLTSCSTTNLIASASHDHTVKFWY